MKKTPTITRLKYLKDVELVTQGRRDDRPNLINLTGFNCLHLQMEDKKIEKKYRL
jgi:hypothetical protein